LNVLELKLTLSAVVPRAVPVGVPVESTFRISTVPVAEVGPNISETWSRPPVMPAVKVWAIALVKRGLTLTIVCFWSSTAPPADACS
jgi:hypothetical protein